jgi:lysophospholipase L1-like esterase
VISHSQLLLHIAESAQRKAATPPGSVAPEPRSSEEEYIAHFLEMNRMCVEKMAWFGILLPVYRDPNTPGVDPSQPDAGTNPDEGARMTAYRNRLRDVAKENNIAAIGFPELTEASWPSNKTLFGERIHPNAAGHRLMAERLLEFLAEPLARLNSK